MSSEYKKTADEKSQVSKLTLKNLPIEQQRLRGMFKHHKLNPLDSDQYSDSGETIKNYKPDQVKEYIEKDSNLRFYLELFEKLEFEAEACIALIEILCEWRETEFYNEFNFIKLFSMSKDHIKSVIKLVNILVTTSEIDTQANFDKVIANARFARHILDASKVDEEVRIHGQEDVDFFTNLANLSDIEILLKRKKLNLLLEDIKESKNKKEITIDAPITAHAACVYHYQIDGSKELNDSGHRYDSNAINGKHGITHLAAVSFYVPVVVNFLARHGNEDAKKLTPDDIKLLQITALFHDIGREARGVDYWDHDSGLILYHYLTSVLGIDKEKAKMLAEAVANKDAESQGFYRTLVEYQEGKFCWGETVTIPPPNIYRTVIHEADCLDVKRVRHVFNASHMHMWEQAKQNETMLDELAQLVAEVHGGITERGEAYNDLNTAVKQRYSHANAYGAIKGIFIKPEETLEEKKKNSLDFERGAHYRLIPKLYDPEGFKDSMSLEQLPTTTVLSVKNDWESRMRRGELYARVIDRPTRFAKLEKKISKRTNQPKEPETDLEFELRKLSRQEGIETRSGVTGKRGFPVRSVSMLGYNAATFAGVALVIHATTLDDINQLHTTSINSGRGKKKEFRQEIKEAKEKSNRSPDEEKAKKLERHEILLNYLKTGYDPIPKKESEKTGYNEVIMTLTYVSAILVSHSYKKKPEEKLLHPHADLLKAVYLQKACAARGKELPILEYANNPTTIKEKVVTDEQVLEMWTAVCTHYLQQQKARGVNLSTMTVEEIQTRSICALEETEDINSYDAADKYYDETLKQGIRQAIVAVQARLHPPTSVVSSNTTSFFSSSSVSSATSVDADNVKVEGSGETTKPQIPE